MWLDIARFDSDKVELQESEFLLTTLLMDEQKQMLPLARQKGLSLEVNAPRESLVIPHRSHQAWPEFSAT